MANSRNLFQMHGPYFAAVAAVISLVACSPSESEPEPQTEQLSSPPATTMSEAGPSSTIGVPVAPHTFPAPLDPVVQLDRTRVTSADLIAAWDTVFADWKNSPPQSPEHWAAIQTEMAEGGFAPWVDVGPIELIVGDNPRVQVDLNKFVSPSCPIDLGKLFIYFDYDELLQTFPNPLSEPLLGDGWYIVETGDFAADLSIVKAPLQQILNAAANPPVEISLSASSPFALLCEYSDMVLRNTPDKGVQASVLTAS